MKLIHLSERQNEDVISRGKLKYVSITLKQFFIVIFSLCAYNNSRWNQQQLPKCFQYLGSVSCYYIFLSRTSLQPKLFWVLNLWYTTKQKWQYIKKLYSQRNFHTGKYFLKAKNINDSLSTHSLILSVQQ